MATRVLLTIDAELTSRHMSARGCWRENFARSFDPAGVGVPFQLDLLERHGLKACFFVDPMPALLHGIDPVRRMVEPILAAGQEIQLHLHSFWKGLAAGNADGAHHELTAFDGAGQRDLIRTARDLLVEAGAPTPIAFRAGSYAANAATLDALRDLGLRYDSSHNGSHHPEPSALPLDPRLIEPALCRGIVEVPVTQIEQSGGGLRHLQICAVSSAEMQAASLHAANHGHSLVTIVSHSFELATRDGLRPNKLHSRRFEALCAFLESQAGQLPTTTFADLGEPSSQVQTAEPMPVRPLRTARRVVEQLWANARYERPATAVTAVSGSSVAGAEMLANFVGG